MMHREQAGPSAGYRIFSVIRTIFIYILALGIILGAVLFAVDRSPQKSLFGYRYYTVLTPSMSPEFTTGDMVLVKLRSGDEIDVGDIITFNPSSSSDAYLTHRVTEKIVDYEGTGVTCFRTKGDANDSEDSFLIDEDRVIGTVEFSVPKLGTIFRFVQLRWYFILPLVILLFIFFRLIRMYFEPSDEEEKAQETDSEDAVEVQDLTEEKAAAQPQGSDTPEEPQETPAPSDSTPAENTDGQEESTSGDDPPEDETKAQEAPASEAESGTAQDSQDT
ncbi:MAG: signal peptidase I [Oscillospiraceae bacterium]|nr:signal peptidase I [Oscillospiraceae bacterium]